MLGSDAVPVSEIRVGYGQRCGGTLTLSDTDNLLSAATVQVGNSNGGNQGSSSELILGAGRTFWPSIR
jgi:hypothetical protein